MAENTVLQVIDYQIIYAVISVAVSAGAYCIIRWFFERKLSGLKGANKLTGLSLIVIGTSEFLYLATSFDLVQVALEVIAYLGLGFWIILFSFQNHFKNVASGISNYMNPDLDVGDIVEIEGVKGIVVDMGITKTTLLTDEGTRIFVPNLKFSEEVARIFHKKKVCEHIKRLDEQTAPKTEGCEECEKEGSSWNGLRLCLTCGHVGCDRTSTGMHAAKHFRDTGHPVIVALPTRKWKWCYVHDAYY